MLTIASTRRGHVQSGPLRRGFDCRAGLDHYLDPLFSAPASWVKNLFGQHIARTRLAARALRSDMHDLTVRLSLVQILTVKHADGLFEVAR
jgi:hypothetical protein